MKPVQMKQLQGSNVTTHPVIKPIKSSANPSKIDRSILSQIRI